MENSMKNNKKNIGLVLLFLVGLSILLYPTVSSKWNAYRANQLISNYTGMIKNDTDEELNAMIQKAYNYNETLQKEAVPDAFSMRDGIKDDVYESLLNLNSDGMMGYIELPSIDITLPIYHYTTEDVLKKGVGHLLGSSLPVGGKSTHSVLSAHRGLPSAELFTNLNLLEKGDYFLLHILNQDQKSVV